MMELAAAVLMWTISAAIWFSAALVILAIIVELVVD